MRLLSEIVARSRSGAVDPQDVTEPSEANIGTQMALDVGYRQPGPQPSTADAETQDEALLLTGALGDMVPELEAPRTPGSLAEQPLPPQTDTHTRSRRAMAQEAMKLLKERAVTEPDPGTAGDAAGPAKTRLLGFGGGVADTDNVFDTSAPSPQTGGQASFPVGWLVVVAGPGTGASFALHEGAAQIGRGADQAISLDFGDTAISRTNHAAIAYDGEMNAFYLGHGGKTNIVRLNNKPVLSTEELSLGDEIRIGETTLRFVPLCGADFSWATARAEG